MSQTREAEGPQGREAGPAKQRGGGPSGSSILQWGALTLGVVLLGATLWYIDLTSWVQAARSLGFALPAALFVSGLWHLARTAAWAACFPPERSVSFAHLARVRLAAEAFSYLTLRGIAGEPLKVVLLADRVDAREATAAVALERISYLVGTVVIIGISSLMAMALLPLTHGWFRVFRAFAIAMAIITALTIIVITGHGSYLQSVLRGIDRRTGSSLATGRIGGFVIVVERHMLDLIRGNPRRLATLLAMTAAAYACMALEAWVILRGAGVPISVAGAITVETFSRVASFASAFIPANIGALEASSLAAVAAIGAGGGAALAIARRIRGLVWAAIGLAIYPRRQRRTRIEDRPRASADDGGSGATLLYFPEDPAVSVRATARIAGLPIAERVVRAALRAGYRQVLVWAPAGRVIDPGLAPLLRGIRGVAVVTDSRDWCTRVSQLAPSGAVTVIGAGTVVSPELFAGAEILSTESGGAVDVPAGAEWRQSGVLRVTASDAADPRRVLDTLADRRQRRPALPSGEDVANGRAKLALRFSSAGELAEAERTIRRSSYKDTDATVARFNRRMSLPISIALIRTPITANQLSILLVAMGFYSAWLFSIGRYWPGVLAGFLSLAASVLDGCDGEIARLKFQESALGCWIETAGDYSYYIAIFVGLSMGAVRHTGSEAFYWVGAIALAGTLISFMLLIYLRSRITAGRPEKLHAIARDRFKAQPTLWSRVIWRISFVATRAAMPYGIMAFALLNALPAIVVLAAIGANIYWVSVVVRLRELLGPDAAESVVA
jgi:phosphatidylglycerophosphate synthase